MKRADVVVHPLTRDRWPDLVKLFGAHGACGGCWCMWWRRPGAEFSRGKGAENRAALRRVVAVGPPPGLLAYAGEEPIGWIALAPREKYSKLGRSRVLKPVDDRPVWSLTCFFVARHHRRKGVTVRLLRSAVAFAREQGARVLEGYPIDVGDRTSPDVWVYTGLLPAFHKAGFREVARRSKSRPIMRRAIQSRAER